MAEVEFEVPLTRKTAAAVVGGLLLLVVLLVLDRRPVRKVPPAEAWAVAVREAGRHDLDPRFVFALMMAESSLDAHAETSVARGIMQLTEGTWSETTARSYREAFNWRLNVAVGVQHLADLRARLEADDRYNYPRLAASYRYGYYALQRKKYSVERLPTPRNRIYQELFRGELPDPARWGVEPTRG